jgi:hypothetical protein
MVFGRLTRSVPVASLRAGVAVGADQRGPGEHDAELRRDDVHDALVRVADVEQPDPCLERGFARLGDEGAAARHARVVAAAGEGVDDVVHGAEDATGVGDPAAGLPQALQRDGPGALVQQHAVDGEQRRLAGGVQHDMLLPDPVEEGARGRLPSHGRPSSGELPLF